MEFNSITTERFILRVLTSDLVGENYLSWFADKQTANYIEYAKNQVTLEKLKEYVEEKFKSSKALMFGIFVKGAAEHIGNIKFEPIDFSEGTAVLGVLIGSSQWRSQGVFSEINKILEDHLKAHGIRRIYLGVDRSNEPAIKAYQKSGYLEDPENFLSLDIKKSVCMRKNLG